MSFDPRTLSPDAQVLYDMICEKLGEPVGDVLWVDWIQPGVHLRDAISMHVRMGSVWVWMANPLQQDKLGDWREAEEILQSPELMEKLKRLLDR